jgi:hypothetical protein
MTWVWLNYYINIGTAVSKKKIIKIDQAVIVLTLVRRSVIGSHRVGGG